MLKFVVTFTPNFSTIRVCCYGPDNVKKNCGKVHQDGDPHKLSETRKAGISAKKLGTIGICG